MQRVESQRAKTLKYVLRTRNAPDQVKRTGRSFRIISLVLGTILILAPILYFRELGYSKYLIALLSGVGAILVFWGEVNRSSTEQIEHLHDFIDFERMKNEVDRLGA